MIPEDRMNQTQIDELLLYYLRASPDKIGDGKVKPLSEVDWEDLLQQSDKQAISPLLYHRLCTLYSDTPVSANVRGKLRQAYLENAARNLGLYQNLGTVLTILRRDRIPVIVLKGAHLAAHIYGNLTLRSMGDVDLLVHQDDVMKVEAALLGIGYIPHDHSRIMGRDNRHFAYRLSKSTMWLEIHWTLLPSAFSFNIDMDGQWERARAATIAGVDAAVLSPEDLLLHLCLHACEQGFRPGLRSLCDICWTLQHHRSDMDWEAMRCRSRQWGIVNCVYLTLRLTRELLGGALPDGWLEVLRPDDFQERFMAVAKEQIFSTRPGSGGAPPLPPYIAQFWGSRRLPEKAALLLKETFIPREAMARMYPAPADSLRIYFYYAKRIRDLLRFHGHHVWRLLRDEEGIRASAKDLALFTDWLMSP
ncbi:MAG: nucleotidyltransferase domain-containing protein [Syntrophales bacterium]